MIDFNTYECVQLEDVADFGRAKAGHIYPAGTSTIQISATKGQVGYLEQPGEVESKDVAIIPQAGINPKYFNIVLQKNIGKFLVKYATGLNIQEKEIGNFPIELHDSETQKAIVKLVEYVEKGEEIAQAELDSVLLMKQTLLQKMMV